MSDKKIRTMVTAAVLAALSCVATMVVQIPSPMNGYVNLGDCFVLLSGWLLGPWWGAAAGGIGSMLADLLLGYGHYAPGTLIIKGAMALVAALVLRSTVWKDNVVAGAWMMVLVGAVCGLMYYVRKRYPGKRKVGGTMDTVISALLILFCVVYVGMGAMALVAMNK